jgi:coenzyme F420-reducing hydrogenase delta subunit
VTRQSYAPEIRIIRLMCTGRVDLGFLTHAFRQGADGVIIGGCWPGECHYVTEGNYDALGNVHLCRKLLTHIGVDPERLRIEWIAASEGSRFAEVMTAFVEKLRALGPLRVPDGPGARDLARRLDALNRVVPYAKLVEREKLRVPVKSEAAYEALYGSEETDRLVLGLIGERIAAIETLLLLSEGPASPREIAERLGIGASEVARHLGETSRRGLVRYDAEAKRYALSGGRG